MKEFIYASIGAFLIWTVIFLVSGAKAQETEVCYGIPNLIEDIEHLPEDTLDIYKDIQFSEDTTFIKNMAQQITARIGNPHFDILSSKSLAVIEYVNGNRTLVFMEYNGCNPNSAAGLINITKELYPKLIGRKGI